MTDTGSDSDSDSGDSSISEDKWSDIEIQRIKIITTMVLDDTTTAATTPGHPHQEITVVKQGK